MFKLLAAKFLGGPPGYGFGRSPSRAPMTCTLFNACFMTCVAKVVAIATLASSTMPALSRSNNGRPNCSTGLMYRA